MKSRYSDFVVQEILPLESKENVFPEESYNSSLEVVDVRDSNVLLFLIVFVLILLFPLLVVDRHEDYSKIAQEHSG